MTREETIALVDKVIREFPTEAASYSLGKSAGDKPRAFGFLFGQVMARSGGLADAMLVNKALYELLGNGSE